MARAPLQSLILHRGCLSEAHLGGSSFFYFPPDLILAAEGFKSAQHDYFKKNQIYITSAFLYQEWPVSPMCPHFHV